MSERTDDPKFKYYDYDAAQKDNFSFGGHMYLTTNEGHDSVPASQTPSPGILNQFDQEQNKEWWAEQRKLSYADRGQAHSSQPINTSIGERASNPNYDNDVREGVTESDRVRRGYLRADFARKELESNPGKWANKAPGCSIGYPKCNEFVYESHFSGDPQGSPFPTVIRNNPSYFKPTVDILADPNFAPEKLEYLPDAGTARPGDTIVWYGNGNHHSAIATGNGKVIYASGSGLKENTINAASESFPGSTPIIRRYR